MYIHDVYIYVQICMCTYLRTFMSRSTLITNIFIYLYMYIYIYIPNIYTSIYVCLFIDL